MPEEKKSKGERLQVVLARFGIASRRGVVSMIEDGKVKVNDQVVWEKGFRVDASVDKIIVEGREFVVGEPAPRTLFSPLQSTYINQNDTDLLRQENAAEVLLVFRKEIPLAAFSAHELYNNEPVDVFWAP